MNEFITSSKRIYHCPTLPLAEGGEAYVFEIVEDSNLVAKVYKVGRRTSECESKLSVMLSNRPIMSEQFAWPLELIYENGQFIGYVMYKIKYKERLRDIYVYDKRQGKPWSLYITLAKNVAAAVHSVHEIHQVIGDLNPDNILVNPNDGMVALVDTDSYHISDSRQTYRCKVGMPEYVAPELQGIHFTSDLLPTFTEQTDCFALAVIIFQLLMNGAHPFSCKIISGSASKFQPIDNMQKGYCAFFTETCADNMAIPIYSPTINCLPDNIQKLFRRAFLVTNDNISGRPSAEEWYYALECLENELVECPNNPQHLYYSNTKCPWCNVEKKMKERSEMINKGRGIFQKPLGKNNSESNPDNRNPDAISDDFMGITMSF